jgi:hypothetical protein
VTSESACCPTCGAELEGRSICMRCGTLAGLEFGVASLRIRARQFFEARRPYSFQRHHLLWVCALAPMVVLPPLFSLLVSIRAMRRPGDDAEAFNLEWIAIISAINILVSALILYKYHLSLFDMVSAAGALFRSLLRALLLFPDNSNPPVHLRSI